MKGFLFIFLFYISFKTVFAFEDTFNKGYGKQDRINMTEERLIQLKQQVDSQKKQIEELQKQLLKLSQEITKLSKAQNEQNSTSPSIR